jgi:hypothetical protein
MILLFNLFNSRFHLLLGQVSFSQDEK